MSYTTGGQTIDKSMNGVISVDAENIATNTITTNAMTSGTITADTITAPIINSTIVTTDDLVVNNTLQVTGASTFFGNTFFDTLLPTSILTGTPTLTQIAPVSMLNNLYAAVVTGGYARLTTVANSFSNANTFTGINNVFNTGSNGNTANIGLVIRNNNSTGLLNFVPRNQSQGFNTFSVAGDSVIAASPIDSGTRLCLTANSSTNRVGIAITASGFVTCGAQETIIESDQTVATNLPALTIKNLEATPTTVRVLLNTQSAALINPMTAINETLIYGSSGKNLVLTTVGTSACGIRIAPTAVTIVGASTNLNATITNVTNLNATAITINTISPGYTTLPTFTNTQIGYTESVLGASSGVITGALTIATTSTLPIGVYMVSAFMHTGNTNASVNPGLTLTSQVRTGTTVIKRNKNYYPLYVSPTDAVTMSVNIVFPYRVTTPQSLNFHLIVAGGVAYWDNLSPTFTDPPPYLEVVRIA